MNSFKYTIAVLFTALISMSSNAHFGSKGPYGGGSVTCGIKYVNPSNSMDSIIYLGTKEGGVYFSATNAVLGWSAKPVGLKSGKITALAHSGSYLFAATADSGVFRYDGFVGADRYWNKANNGLTNLQITSLVTVDSITVFAGTNGGGVFKSTDKGKNWIAVNNHDLHHLEISSLVKVGKRIIAVTNEGMWASTDLGASWFGLNDTNTEHIAGTNTASINLASNELMINNENGLFIASKIDTIMKPVYASASNGLPSGLKIRSISNDGTKWYLATDKGLYISATDVINWVANNTGLSTLDITTVVPYRTSLIVGSSNEGIFKSSNSSISFTSLNTGFNNLKTTAVITSGVLIITATEKGVFVSRDMATTYTRANKGLLDSLNVRDLTFNKYCLIAATKSGVYFTKDTGRTWDAAVNGLTDLNCVKIISSDAKKYVISESGLLFASNLHSYDWTSIMFDLPSNTKVKAATLYNDKIVIATSAGVYHKTLSATTWTSINSGLANQELTCITASKDKLFVGTNGAGVFVSDTAFINWNQTSKLSISHTTMLGLDGSKVQAVYADPQGWVFASYKGGLLVTIDNGVTWVAGGNQFNLPTFANVYKIGVATGNATTPGRVFVTTSENGAYSNANTELPKITNALEDVKNSSNANVSPNPNTGNFIINADLGASVTVLNSVGNKIAQFESSQLNQAFSVTEKGIYFVQIKQNDNSKTVKMIVE